MDGPSADRLRLALQQSQTVVHQMVNDTFVLVPPFHAVKFCGRLGTGLEIFGRQLLFSTVTDINIRFFFIYF